MRKITRRKRAAGGNKTPRRPSAKAFRFGYLVHDVSRIRRTVMDQAMRPLGVTRSQWTVLGALSRGDNDGMTQVDLARLNNRILVGVGAGDLKVAEDTLYCVKQNIRGLLAEGG